MLEGKASVFGTEVVAPFRDAVGLVDGEEGNLERLQELDSVLLGEGLGGNVEELGVALEEVVLDFAGLDTGEGRIEEVGHTLLAGGVADGVDLVFHQRNEGRNNDGSTLTNHRRQLVTEGFSPSGGHNDESIVPTQKALND
mgnify:CR=1 FL=1